MADPVDGHSEQLVGAAAEGGADAIGELLETYRERLRKMVAVRIDPWLSARLDPSDVVQEAFVEAAKRLPEYMRTTPLPFYPWLRQLTWEQFMHIRVHQLAEKRSPLREEALNTPLSESGMARLVDQVAAVESSPSGHAVHEEARERVRDAIGQLEQHDREVLILRYLEQLETREIAAALGIREGAVRMRHLRALERLRVSLGKDET